MTSAQRVVDPARIRRLLFVRPRYLGDVCLTLPSVEAARAACPGAQVAYVVEKASAPLLSGDPRIDLVVAVKPGAGPAETARLIRRLRRFSPDLAFDLFCNPRTALWTYLSGARVRVGYPFKGWRSRLYTHHARPRTLSAIGFHLASIAALGWPAKDGIPRLHLAENSRIEAQQALTAMGVTGDAVIAGFHPGARWETRRWDADRFAALARRFLESEPRGIALVTGGAGEAERVRSIVRAIGHPRAHEVIDWPIDRFVALQSLCVVFVCGDTGPLHTAVAAGTPTLGLMSRNRPAMFFPYPEALGHRAYYARAECSPCHRDQCADLRCLDRLTVDRAWMLLKEILTQRRAPSS